MQVAQGVQDTLLSINLLSVDQPTQKEVCVYLNKFINLYNELL